MLVKMAYMVNCEDGICYIAICSLDKFMFCGSITDSWYQEMPPVWIGLNKKQLDKNIILLGDTKEYEAKLEMISENSFCLRVYKFDSDLGCEDSVVPFKINPDDLMGIIRDNFEILCELRDNTTL